MNTLYDIICFDVDSTLVECEGLDWLAEQKGVGKKVKKLTELSMNGEVPIEKVFGNKLDIIRPTLADLYKVGEYYCSQITEGAEETIDALHQLGIDIWLVSGSFTPALLPLAQRLNIDSSHIHANEVYLSTSGDYNGINLNCSLTKANGKAECAKKIGKGKRTAFIGDSVTDLATKPVVKTFIGYGGVSQRKRVKDEAEFFIKFRSIKPLLALVY
ncbi:phosphoserine phosphatase [soil metagenome]